MALTGTGAVLGLAIKAAREQTASSYMAGKTSLSDDQRKELAELIAKAEGEAIVAHIVANGVGAVVPVSGPTFPGSII